MKTFQFSIAFFTALILFGCSNSKIENQDNQANEKLVIRYECNGYLDQGQGGKYLLIGPDSEVPAGHDADYVIMSTSNLVFFGTRIIGLDGEAYENALKKHRVYRTTESGEDQKFIAATENPAWMGNQPNGLEYWEDLNRVLQNEPVVDRNRFILTQLRGTGIEKGSEFSPEELQKEVLNEAEEMGNAIAMVHTFSRESSKEKHWPDRNRLYILNMEYLDHIHPN